MDSASAANSWKIFDEVKPDLKPKEVMEEANRCLFCFDAPCMKACPTHIDVPSFIKKITTGNMKGSARVIMDANPVAATCARVCPTEELCEGACVLNDASLPIMIGDLQRHTMNWAMKNNPQLFEAGEPNGKKVAVIGGGPAGLSAARELARFGYQVTIFEKKEKAGGLDTFGIVPFRLPQHVALWEVEQVKKLGVTIQTNTEVGVDVSIQSILDDYDAVLLAIGMADVPPIGIPGEDLDGVLDAIQLIERVKDGHVTERFVGKKAVVIGAGNTAIDAATCLKRLGADRVQILYRRSEEEMTAYPFEFSFAKEEGIEFRWQTQPKAIEGDSDGKVASVVCAPMMLGEKDASGRRRPIEIDNAPFTIDTDVVVKAIGQTRYLPLIEAFGLAHAHGVVTVDPLTYQTSNPKVFAAGDVIFGSGKGEAMVVAAAEQGKKTAQAIHEQQLSKI
ncbi:NAD(P)-dependent oxidoreductase [Sporolactobacillus terrae]|uniref:NAD(P)-dependent oxidoreductase n=1 Tax=Sporolactobacillus terrae TaxID=269673 RepID=UPI00111AD7C1|nr:NAD(P)-dependent oxidoreductase [Sporolactobacillus terrae]